LAPTLNTDPQRQLYTSSSHQTADVPNDLHNITSDLTARFKRLHASANAPVAPASTSKPSLTEDPDNEEQSIQDLLAELGPEEQWTLNQDEESNITALLDEARSALPFKEDELVTQYNAPVPSNGKRPDTSSLTDTPPKKTSIHNFTLDDEEQEDKNDDREADEYLQSVLDGLANEPQPPFWQEKMEGKQHTQTADPSSPGPSQASVFDLPSTPSALPQSPGPHPAEADPSSDLSLPSAPTDALSLPSTPSALPTTKKIIKGSKKEYDYTEEDIATWCTICNDDATIKCVGCEGELYCARCWRETHAGMEERGHRWVKYVRK
jgi:hypothetical protein